MDGVQKPGDDDVFSSPSDETPPPCSTSLTSADLRLQLAAVHTCLTSGDREKSEDLRVSFKYGGYYVQLHANTTVPANPIHEAVVFALDHQTVPTVEIAVWFQTEFGLVCRMRAPKKMLNFFKDFVADSQVALVDVFGTTEHGFAESLNKSKIYFFDSADCHVEIELQFGLYDPGEPNCPVPQLYTTWLAFVRASDVALVESAVANREQIGEDSVGSESGINESTVEETMSDEKLSVQSTDRTGSTKSKAAWRIKRRQRFQIRRRTSLAHYQLFPESSWDIQGVVFMELLDAIDLPPESNSRSDDDPLKKSFTSLVTRTSFDMDPFLIVSFGKKTFRSKVVQHNLNPVFKEKIVFTVRESEKNYTIFFKLMDHDKLSGHDYIGTCTLPLQKIFALAPKPDPSTDLYMPERIPAINQHRWVNKSSTSIVQKAGQILSSSQRIKSSSFIPGLIRRTLSFNSLTTIKATTVKNPLDTKIPSASDPDFTYFCLPLELSRKGKWEDKHWPKLNVRAKYIPYAALRQKFWRSLLHFYDANSNGMISKVELSTLLDSIGSTISESTVDIYFRLHINRERNQQINGMAEITIDEAVLCLDELLHRHNLSQLTAEDFLGEPVRPLSEKITTASTDSGIRLSTPHGHIISIRVCPFCRHPRMRRRSEVDIITHVATCASRDWNKIDRFLMGGFVTSDQAQRKWYGKVISKLTLGNYELGANSAIILVQDRLTGQIQEEKMSLYVRLGIRLLYKGLKAGTMEKQRVQKLLRTMSEKQGKKYDSNMSVREIKPFIAFHKLDMSEVRLGLSEFNSFNEFFYRKLKPGVRPCTEPKNRLVIVSPADSRTVVYNYINRATEIWIKGREFTIERLLGDPLNEEAKIYINGSMGIFRLAPQDYHRFHVPVEGVVGRIRVIQVNPMAIRSTLDVFGENVRTIVPIETKDFGRVIIVCVGAMMVGSIVITVREGQHINRCDELGYFKFGGSTLIILFPPGVMVFDSDLIQNSLTSLETFVRVGMSIGHHPSVGQFITCNEKLSVVGEAEKRAAAERVGDIKGGP